MKGNIRNTWILWDSFWLMVSNMFFFYTENWGDDRIWRAFFSNGLKPPIIVFQRNIQPPKNQSLFQLKQGHQRVPGPVYGCFLKRWYAQNTPKWSFLVGKPMVVGYHHFRKPHIYIYTYYVIFTKYMPMPGCQGMCFCGKLQGQMSKVFTGRISELKVTNFGRHGNPLLLAFTHLDSCCKLDPQGMMTSAFFVFPKKLQIQLKLHLFFQWVERIE